MKKDARPPLAELFELVSALHKRVAERSLRLYALQIRIAQITGVSQQLLEVSLQEIERELQEPSHEKSEQVAAIIEALRKGKNLNEPDS